MPIDIPIPANAFVLTTQSLSATASASTRVPAPGNMKIVSASVTNSSGATGTLGVDISVVRGGATELKSPAVSSVLDPAAGSTSKAEFGHEELHCDDGTSILIGGNGGLSAGTFTVSLVCIPK